MPHPPAPRLQRRTELLQRNLRLGLEPDRARYMRLFAAGLIVGPFPRQIQLIGDRQAGMMVGDRQRHRHLAIGLLAELTAILTLYSDRMLALLGERRIVDDPGFDRAALRHRRHHQFAHFRQHPFIRPRRIGDDVLELLMLLRYVLIRFRLGRCRHRLHAAPAHRHQQPGAITHHRPHAVRMPAHLRHFAKVRCQATRGLKFAIETHPSLPLIGIRNLDNHLILKQDHMRPTDFRVVLPKEDTLSASGESFNVV
jgi:hypothetical protein